MDLAETKGSFFTKSEPLARQTTPGQTVWGRGALTVTRDAPVTDFTPSRHLKLSRIIDKKWRSLQSAFLQKWVRACGIQVLLACRFRCSKTSKEK